MRPRSDNCFRSKSDTASSRAFFWHNGEVTNSNEIPTVVSGAEVVSGVPSENTPENPTESVTAPAKVMRIGSMVRQLLEEVRSTQLDEASRERLAEIYERSVVEISTALSPDLAEELHILALPFRDGEVPSEGELRVAKAQLVGWLEGLFHGIQATLFAQQLAARQQIEQMRQIPPGAPGTPGAPGGTYL
jgi:hypothetical protein